MILSANAIRSQIQGLQFKEPKLYDVLMAIVSRLQTTDADIASLQASLESAVTELASADVEPVVTFTYTLFPDYISLVWEQPDSSISNYELRRGASWESAIRVLVTGNLSAVIDPLSVGTHTYLLKSIDSNGIYSATAKQLNIIIPAIGPISITHDVIDNNVLLYWSAPTSSFRITHYIITRNGAEIGTKDGTFTTVFEQVAGTNSYGISAVDVADNISNESLRDVTVTQPPDYVLESSLEDDFSGTKTNCLLENGRLLCCVDTTETWDQHFSNNSYTNIQDQIDAGHELYCQPGETTGNYLQEFDFGSIFTDVLVNVDWSTEVLDEAVTVVCKIRLSDDGSTWTSQVTGTGIFAASVRYVEVELELTGGVNKLMQIFDLTCRVDVKQSTDSGTATCLASDTSGTTVTFNKTFKDINSIVLTVRDTVEKKAIYDFTDVPDPTDFKILVFDTAGTRVNATVSWIARGIT